MDPSSNDIDATAAVGDGAAEEEKGGSQDMVLDASQMPVQPRQNAEEEVVDAALASLKDGDDDDAEEEQEQERGSQDMILDAYQTPSSLHQNAEEEEEAVKGATAMKDGDSDKKIDDADDKDVKD